MTLTNADRCWDLAMLDLRIRSFNGDGTKFIFPGLTKTRRNGKPVETFPRGPQNLSIASPGMLWGGIRRTTLRSFGHIQKPTQFISPTNQSKQLQWMNDWRVWWTRQALIQTFSQHINTWCCHFKAKSARVSAADINCMRRWRITRNIIVCYPPWPFLPIILYTDSLSIEPSTNSLSVTNYHESNLGS